MFFRKSTFFIFAKSVLTCLIGLLALGQLRAAPLVDTTKSGHAKVRPTDVEDLRWTNGFWADRVGVCYESSIPKMWELMKGKKYKPFLEHFLIVAGKAEGGHHGAKWNDGDFYKWLEAAIVANSVEEDAELTLAIDQSIEAIVDAQRDDGYLHTPVLIAQKNGDKSARPFQDRHAFEMYNMGHLITTGCLHYRLTGNKKLLEAAEKAAEFFIKTFSNPTPELARNSICPSHYMATIELYRTTGKQKYLDLAESFLAMRKLVENGGDDNQDRIPFTEQREIVGHAVRANYLNAGAADLYAENGDASLLKPLESLWENMVQKKMYITGACGALYDGASPDGSAQQRQITRIHQAFGRNYQLPNITAHNETCANIANLMWCWRMFLITADAKYLDVLEIALYNSILSGVSLEGTDYFYVNPLRVTDPLPNEMRYPRTRQPFFVSFCCPPNVIRTIAEVGGYAYAKNENGVYVNLYGGSDFTTELFGASLSLQQESNYPWDGDIRIKVKESPGEKYSIRLRIPSWANGAEVSLNNKSIDAKPNATGFVEISRNWEAGDVIELSLPMPAQLIQAHPLVEELSNQVAVQCGPLVYCLESHDLPANVAIEQVIVPWGITLEKKYDPDFLQGVAVIEGEALAKGRQEWSTELYRAAKPLDTTPFKLRLIPYYAWANRGAGEMSVWLPVQ